MSRRTATLSIVMTGFVALGILVTVAPDYLTSQGFPLDDAWIHAVYGREVARSGSLAYNPGVPATGSTSPLWSVLLALPHLLGSPTGVIVILIKLLGFGLHLLTAILLYLALQDDDAVVPDAAFGALLVAFHPDLIAASVSGMEVPLATLIAVGLLYSARRRLAAVYAVLSGLAILARPELALLCALPLAVRGGRWRLLGAGAFGTLAAFGLMAVRNVAVSGLPLPGPFYAKVGGAIVSIPRAVQLGFAEMLSRIPIMDSSILLAVAALASVFLLSTRTTIRDSSRLASASILCGLLYCATSFLLVAPFDPESFYHQRYVLPALPLIIGPLPMVVDALIRRALPGPKAALLRVCLVMLIVGSLLVDAPTRYGRLSSDARNIDDVQVRLGRTLAHAPRSDVVWAVDAGAIRYFGSAYVVDLMGLNTPPLLGPDAQVFLDQHPPSYVEIVPTWSSLEELSGRKLRSARFEPTTEYTVTSVPAMQTHWLVQCDGALGQGRVTVRAHTFRFSCLPEATDFSRSSMAIHSTSQFLPFASHTNSPISSGSS